MRKLVLLGVLSVVIAACSSTDDAASTTTAAQTDSTTTAAQTDSTTSTTVITESGDEQTSTSAAVTVPPELADHDLDMVVVGDQLMFLAIADSPSLRSQGLMGVTDLGDLDGMLFYWRHEASGEFWMEDTLIPLDIVWFNEDGTYAGRASMVPCTEESCPTYTPEGDPDYRFAIEARPGDLDWVDDSTVIVYSD